MSRRDPELAEGVGLEALGDRRHAVGLLDAEGHGLRIGAVAAEQRDVGAVQRGDDARHARRLARRRQNLPRQIRGRRVRDRVVRVDDVELLVARDLDDLVRERQQVLRLPEERIAGVSTRWKDSPGW